MKTQAIVIELLEDTVISATSATVGAHHSLDYIPGATLLGAAAARLYGQLGSASFEVFHGNAARFSDGLPWVSDRVAWPVPLCWHERKFNPARNKEKVDGALLVNLATEKRPAQQQIKQLREAHVDVTSGAWVQPTLRMRMKTALENGSAKEGALFGYEALPAGSRFLATVSARDEQLLEQLLGVFDQGLLIGRSRSAEYGRARVSRQDAPAPPQTVHSSSGEHHFLYLASDLCLLNKNGQPCLAPQGEALGLGGAALVPEKSFLRTRRYAPWNAYRGHHDMERQVIARGSVLALKGDIAPESLDAIARDGLGLYRNQGLGHVMVNPDFVVKPEEVIGSQGLPAVRQTASQAPDSPLIRLLVARAGKGQEKSTIARQAESFARQIRKTLEDARLGGGVLDSEDFGPSASQWNKFRDLYQKDFTTDEALLHAIFGADTGIARADHSNWKEPIWVGSEQIKIADWFQHALVEKRSQNPIKNAKDQTNALRQLVIETAILMAKEEAR